MLRYVFMIITFLTACSKGETYQVAEKTDPSKAYEMKKINKTVDDELSPLGFWEINLEYPILISSNNPIIDALNKKIEVLSVQYSCEDNRGDKQFNASVTYTNNLVTSIHFTDSWLCAGMPHSDGRIGSITFDHQSGNDVK